jgi:hypothetical protein
MTTNIHQLEIALQREAAEHQKQLIKDCDIRQEFITYEDLKFLSDMEEILETGNYLTPEQDIRLEIIWSDALVNG